MIMQDSAQLKSAHWCGTIYQAHVDATNATCSNTSGLERLVSHEDFKSEPASQLGGVDSNGMPAKMIAEKNSASQIPISITMVTDACLKATLGKRKQGRHSSLFNFVSSLFWGDEDN